MRLGCGRGWGITALRRLPSRACNRLRHPTRSALTQRFGAPGVSHAAGAGEREGGPGKPGPPFFFGYGDRTRGLGVGARQTRSAASGSDGSFESPSSPSGVGKGPLRSIKPVTTAPKARAHAAQRNTTA
ncbi:hypothetical protein QFZ24_009808 [Streptomyces phaeochromogenes]|nr:hypothetical protein [Streptomyces phaeochromogenes]